MKLLIKKDKLLGLLYVKIVNMNLNMNTSTLKCHKRPDKNEKQPKITSYWAKKQVSAAAKEQTTKKIVNLVCKDLRPFEIILGQGFKEFSQELT